MLTNVKGDVLTNNKDVGKTVVVCHQVNCKGVMGSGLAKQVKEKFPEVFVAYNKKCLAGDAHIGDVQFCPVIEKAGYIVANCFGQYGYGRDKVHTNYEAIEQCFRKIRERFGGAVIRIPFNMGCGLGGGNWDVVYSIIQTELVSKGCNVEIWYMGNNNG